MTVIDSVTCCLSCRGDKVYIHYRRLLRASTRRDDINFYGLDDLPAALLSTDGVQGWRTKMVRAQAAIVPTLTNDPISKLGHIIDGDGRTAKGLWVVLGKL